jgi:hypothetical protein
MKDYLSKSLLPLGLCFSISLNGFLPQALAQNAPARIDVVVVEGEGAISNVHQRVTHDPVVRVEDDDHRPVAGAIVVFALPVSGASGEFVNGSKTLTITTDKSGVAAAQGLKANEVPGKLQIYVTASYRGLHARTLINQVLQAPPGTKIPESRASKASSKGKWILLGIAAAGGAGAAFYFKNRNSTSPAVAISAGTVAFGSPR